MKKLFLLIMTSLVLLGCEDTPENTNIVKSTPVEQVQLVIEDPESYTMFDVENNYVTCLLTEGLDQDDYCEEACSDIFDVYSCDVVEDKYEELYGIGSDSPSSFVPLTQSKKIKNTSSWVKYKAPSCNSSTCKQAYVQTVYYKDGSKGNVYKYENTSKSNTLASEVKQTSKNDNKNYQHNSSLVSQKDQNKVENHVNKYNSNLVKPKPKAQDSSNTNKYNSNLVQPKSKAQDSSNTNKYTSNLVQPKKIVKETPKPKKITVVGRSLWKDVGQPSCSSWLPKTSNKPKGTKFNQKSNCTQKQSSTVTYSDGSKKVEYQYKKFNKSKPAYGTKKTRSSKSDSNSKKSNNYRK